MSNAIATSNRKRRRTTSIPSASKTIRARSAPVTDPQSFRRRPRLINQTTLTQIDFVKQGTSYIDDVLVTRIPEDETDRIVARRRATRSVAPRIQKQDSTLTQMGWVNARALDNFEEDLIAPLPPSPTISATTASTVSHTSSNFPAQDMAPPPRSTGSRQRKRRSEAQPESQDYRPTSPKRRKLDTPIQSRTNPRRSTRTTDFTPPLIIADSTDFVEISPEKSSIPAQLKTPIKNRERIPSSQTPESLKPSSRKKSVKRAPLAELPTNIQISPSKAKGSPNKKHSSPTKSKICTLKVPKRALPPRIERRNDDNHDLWSVQPTSSNRHSSSPDQNEVDTDITTTTEEPDEEKIIARNANHIQDETQDSLPDLDTIFRNPTGRRRRGTMQGRSKKINIESFPRKEPSPSTQMQPMSAPLNLFPELQQIQADMDDDSEFGSPTRNDTQFIKDLQQRVSSPSPTPAEDDVSPVKKLSPKRKGLLGTSRATSPDILSPLPAPRLVKSPAAGLKRHPSTSTITTLPSISTPQLSSSPRRRVEKVKIVQLPLNDTAEYQKSSSSPALPPNDRHIFPASIPHPSQVSTQAPSTQGFFSTTPASNSRKTTNQSLVELAAVSDSSSVPKAWSQVRVFDEQRIANDLDEDDSMDELEDDLNPATYRVYGEHKSAETQDAITQSPTQASHRRSGPKRQATTQSSPIIIDATTRSQRDAKLEVIDISMSSQMIRQGNVSSDNEETPKAPKNNLYSEKYVQDQVATTSLGADATTRLLSSPTSSSVYSPSPPRPLKRKYSPIPGFDNDTQADFTQNGHITAAYVHRAREDGILPLTYTPKPYQIKKGNGTNKGPGRKSK